MVAVKVVMAVIAAPRKTKQNRLAPGVRTVLGVKMTSKAAVMTKLTIMIGAVKMTSKAVIMTTSITMTTRLVIMMCMIGTVKVTMTRRDMMIELQRTTEVMTVVTRT